MGPLPRLLALAATKTLLAPAARARSGAGARESGDGTTVAVERL